MTQQSGLTVQSLTQQNGSHMNTKEHITVWLRMLQSLSELMQHITKNRKQGRLLQEPIT